MQKFEKVARLRNAKGMAVRLQQRSGNRADFQELAGLVEFAIDTFLMVEMEDLTDDEKATLLQQEVAGVIREAVDNETPNS